MERSQFEYTNPKDRDNKLTVTMSNEGLYVEIEEEMALDSYNYPMTCSIMLPLSAANALVKWLSKI